MNLRAQFQMPALFRVGLGERESGGTSAKDSVEALFRSYEDKVFRRTDRLFLVLLGLQWVAGIVFALLVSPHAWEGSKSTPHPHLYAAVFLGGACCLFPMMMILLRPGHVLTRQAVAIGQVSFSGLLIHLTGGRIETHFHVFGSLAFLACYRDWKVLTTATVIVASDHLARSLWYPESVYGIAVSTPWRTVEHSAWVLFEDIVLLWSCVVSRREMFSICERQFQNQQLLDELEIRVQERTSELKAEVFERRRAEAELRASEEQIRTWIQNAPIGIYRSAVDGSLELANPALVEMLGLGSAPLVMGRRVDDFRQDGRSVEGVLTRCMDREGHVRGHESVWRRADGTEVHVRENINLRRDTEGRVISYEGTVEDITEWRKSQQEVKALNARLVESSRLAGMAEVATNVLHNVGNVLNSVNISASLVADRIREGRSAGLSRAVALINEHAADLGSFMTTHPKGRQLPGYLASLSEYMAREREASLQEIDLLRRNIEHIREIVAVQQGYAKVEGVDERLKLDELLTDSVRMSGLPASKLVRVTREPGDDEAEIVCNRNKVIQVIVNLLRNAERACLDSTREEKCVVVAAKSVNQRVTISITDNGVGIPQDNLVRIFTHGFTTRRDGHGFGLHSSANVAKELGGSLYALSDGPGMGARFVLELPAERERSGK